MADYIFDGEVPNQTGFDGTWHTFATNAILAVDAQLIGGRAWFPASTPANFFWVVYDTADESVVALVDLTTLEDPTGNAWNDFDPTAFDTPGAVDLSAGQYRVGIATNGDFVFDDDPEYPIEHNAVITADMGTFHNGGTGPVYPEEETSTFGFFGDMLVETATPEPSEGTAVFDVDYTLAAAGEAEHAGQAAHAVTYALTASGARPSEGTAALVWTVNLAAFASDSSPPGALTASGTAAQMVAGGTAPVLGASGSTAALTASGTP